MSIWLQIIIGFLPALVLAIILIFMTRGKAVQWIASFVMLMAVGAGLALSTKAGIFDFEIFEKSTQAEAVTYHTEAESEDYLAVAYAFMEKDEYAEAEAILDEFLSHFVYCEDYALAAARLNVLKGDLYAADGLYRAVDSMGGRETVLSRAEQDETDAVQNALDASLKYSSWERAVREVRAAVRDLGDELDGIAGRVVSTYLSAKEDCEKWHTMSASEQESTAEELERWVEQLVSDEADSKYLSIPAIQSMVVRTHALSGEYSDLAGALSKDSDAQNLLITAELIQNGTMSSSDIKKANRLEQNENNTSVVEEWINTQLVTYEYSPEEQAIIDEILAEITFPSDSSASAVRWIKNLILEHIAEGTDTENSKLYLELARLEYAEGNTDKASVYLNMVLGEAKNSKDPEYIGAADALLNIIQSTQDTEARKQVADHTEALIDSLLSDGVGAVTAHKTGDNSGYADSEPLTSDNATEEAMPFEQYVTDTINQGSGLVDIISVDVSQFEQIEATIAVDETIAMTADDFRDNLNLFDCSISIDDYTTEKLIYQKVNIALVCDNSGSMEGTKIEDLKNALNTFIGASSTANFAIVPFDSGVNTERVCPFGSGPTMLKDCVDFMSAGGGTNISSAVNYALELFPASNDTLNVLILMSDGQDSYPSDSSIANMAAACAAKNASIYSMGLGSDVDSNVLNAYSDLGGGSYMYVTGSDSLLSFYQYIYRLCMNRYRVCYQAIDTVKNRRLLELESKNSIMAYDDYTYYLYDSDISGDDLGDEYQVAVGDVVLNGLENRLFYRSSIAQTTNLIGRGFKKEDTVSVELHGGVQYSLESKYVDDGRIQVTVPSNVACGVYDVYVTYNGRRTVFQSGLVMTSQNRHIVRFGNYIFTATDLATSGDSTILSGVVHMNEWLGFLNRVTLKGDLAKDYTVVLGYDGAYLQYTDNGTCTGLARYLAQNGYVQSLPGVSSLKLYNDATTAPSSDSYPADKVFLNAAYLRVVDFVGVSGAGMFLYPDRMVIDFEAFDTKFPFQDAVMKVSSLDDLFSFKLDHSEQIIFKSDQIGCKLSFELGQNSKEYSGLPGKLGNLKLYFKDASMKLDLDTIQGDINFKVLVDVAFLTDGLGTQVSWKDWKFDAMTLYADKDINTYIGNVPVTFDDFSLGVSNLSKNPDYSLKSILLSRWTGTFDCSMAKISAVYPGLEKYIKSDVVQDAAIASLDDTTIAFQLNDFYVSVSTRLVLLGIVEVGSCQLELGNGISYTNLLLGMDGASVNGVVGRVTAGLTVDTNNFDLTATGTLKAALTDAIVGLTATGNFRVDLSWWVLVKEYQAEGELFLGSYKQHNGQWQFAVYAAGSTQGGSSMTPVCWPTGALNSASL